MKIKNRIKELRYVSAKQLLPNPKNWRTHPKKQRNALFGVLKDIGYADALLARELPDGSLQLLDGHLRTELTPEQEVPVLIVDLNEKEADKLLTVFDPLAGLAETNQDLLNELLTNFETEDAAIQELLAELAVPTQTAIQEAAKHDYCLNDIFQIVITCQDETEQQTLYEQLDAQGVDCRIVNL